MRDYLHDQAPSFPCLWPLFFTSPALAGGDGINSATGLDLPIGAGGNTVMVIQPGGNVGIGTAAPEVTLDVNGNVRPGAAKEGEACTGEGSLAYDTANHKPVYCNASKVWQGMGGTASLSVYQCPNTFACEDGQNVSGSWAASRCAGQVGTVSTCEIDWWCGGGCHCLNACTALGKLIVQ